MKKREVFAGERFNHLIILNEEEPVVNPGGSVHRRFKCRCDCGREVTVRLSNLVSGGTKSCSLSCQTKTSVYKERLYSVWKHMKKRCYNEECNRYSLYGGRGIKVCDEWKNDYKAFKEWSIAHGYVEDVRESGRNNISLDRIDSNGDYCPDNCRWVDLKTQANNKRNSKHKSC